MIDDQAGRAIWTEDVEENPNTANAQTQPRKIAIAHRAHTLPQQLGSFASPKLWIASMCCSFKSFFSRSHPIALSFHCCLTSEPQALAVLKAQFDLPFSSPKLPAHSIYHQDRTRW